MSERKMLSIWFFVGIMLTILGALVAATGLNYIFHPQDRTVLAHLNTNLWWGLVMLLSGLAFLIPAIIHRRSDRAEDEIETGSG
ncbi:MAG: hypothetical protein JSU77_08785 [Fidelibacterota bacterium]|nr:MAG: hypothetical protein JSU77_08785 [Candidatus Neomarinimicrobiota bacterium]